MQAPFADPLSGLELLAKTLPLVGRDTEMQVISALLDTVALDKPVGARALMISGDMGVGKSRLLAEMCTQARARGFRVLEGRTYESGGMFPYLPFIETLRPALRSSPAAQLRRYVGLDGEQESTETRASEFTFAERTGDPISLTGAPLVTALARLFPELPQMLRTAITQEVLSPDQEKFRLFDAVATLLERMATERPLLLSIDNLQWADSASLELTLYLTVRLHSSHVALVGVTRPPRAFSEYGSSVSSTSMSPAASRALADLMRQGMLLLLPLGPLSADAAEQYLQVLLPGTLSESLAKSLLSRAGGNPFFLEELVRMLTLSGQLLLRDGVWRATRVIGSELPESITLAVGQRLQGLSFSCRELLRVASLFGRTFPLQPLVTVMDVPGDTVHAWIDEAVQSAVIATAPPMSTLWGEPAAEDERISTSRLAPPGYMFCQGIVQEALSNEVPAHRASTLHGAIATALEKSYSGSAQAHAAELARHYVLSGEKEAALRWSLLAGEDAARQQAHREAIGHFRMALELMEAQGTRSDGELPPSNARLHILIGESWFKLGELEQAMSAFQQALERLQREKDAFEHQPESFSLLSAQANRLIADVYRMQGKYELTLAHLQAAQNALHADMPAHQETSAPLVHSAHMSWMSSRSYPGTALSLRQVNTTEHILLLQAQATLDMLFNRAQEAEAKLWQSHQLATEIGDRGSQAFALHVVGWIRGWGEYINEAIRLQEQAHELYVAIGDPFRAALGDQGLGIIYQSLGEMEKARLHNLRGFEQARRYGVRHVLGWLHWNQAVMALFQGDWTGSESYFNQSMQEAEATGNKRLKAVVMQAQAELYFRRGDWQEAERLFQAAIQASINTEWYPSTMALYGHFLAVTGHRSAAQAQLEKAVALPEPVGYAGHFYIPFLAEGYLHLGANEQTSIYIQRIQALRGFMYYGVSVDRILGEVALLEGDWHRAEQAFEDGLALCRRVNNQPEEAAILYEQARAALIRSSAEPSERSHRSLEDVHHVCDRARGLFLRYNMQRAADLVNTLQEGVSQLEHHEREEASAQIVQEHIAGYHLDLHLTRRELEVLRLVAEGQTDREVAEALVISTRTVNRHLGNIFVKLDVPGRAAAVAYAIRQGLVG